ncbi:hypothetical protein AQUCO_11800016v1 [Aquilegia coerulea]|uniref:Fe2OG dioxygenase domain-containing protein n=1 Tax=Aquilegia coerulea TaxID=218851 RepID=A0A2G5C226_AQUCA|nr:hypothetical protein AQUCO_11800016v1 [Aquilegia coerulea]
MARRIMEILMKNIGVESDDSMAENYMGVRVVNMNFYPTCPDPGLTVGIGRHSDIGTITVLLQDDVGGLSIRVQEDENVGNKDEWLEIPPIPGALLINIGDSLQILSNGKYKSAEHRVGTTSTRSRVSIPFFLNPGPKVILGPMPQVIGKDGKAQYKECLFEDYKNNFFGHAYQGKKSFDFVKINSP